MEAQAFQIIKATRICGLWSQVQEELHREEDYGERGLCYPRDWFFDRRLHPSREGLLRDDKEENGQREKAPIC